MGFSQRLNELLNSRGMTAYRLRKELNLSQTTITKWLEDERLPTGDNLVKLADYFNVSLDYLVGRSDNPKGGIK